MHRSSAAALVVLFWSAGAPGASPSAFAPPAPAIPQPATAAATGWQAPTTSLQPSTSAAPKPLQLQPPLPARAASTTLAAPPKSPVGNAASAKPRVLGTAKATKLTADRGLQAQRDAAALEAENAVARAARGHGPALPPDGAGAVLAGPGVAARADVPAGRVAPVFAATTAARPLVREPQGIWYVNNKEIDYTVAPGGYVTIHGRGFGDTMGQLNVFGTTDARQLPMQVVDWHRDEVFALLPAGTRGMHDQAMRLQLVTRDGTTYLNDRGRFRAAREETKWSTHLDRVVQLTSTSSWKATLAANGAVDRFEGGKSIDCKAPGTDRLVFNPPVGYEVSGIDAVWGRDDAGDGDYNGQHGSRVFTPGYSLGEWTKVTTAAGRERDQTLDAIPVNWGVWRSHTSSSFGDGTLDVCSSSYQITVYLRGPAGVSPF